jgi:hypothetical protein
MMKFKWEDGQWVEGEKPKKDTIWKRYVERHPVFFITVMSIWFYKYAYWWILDSVRIYLMYVWDVPAYWLGLS